MKKKPRYVIVTAGGSYCWKCSGTLTLLQKIDGNRPMFYLCWNCRMVVEVGRGEVQNEDALTKQEPVEIHVDKVSTSRLRILLRDAGVTNLATIKDPEVRDLYTRRFGTTLLINRRPEAFR